MMIIMCNTQHLSNTTFEAEFMKKLNNTEAELKKSVAYIKSVYTYSTFVHRIPCLRHPTTCGFGDMIESHSYL